MIRPPIEDIEGPANKGHQTPGQAGAHCYSGQAGHMARAQHVAHTTCKVQVTGALLCTEQQPLGTLCCKRPKHTRPVHIEAAVAVTPPVAEDSAGFFGGGSLALKTLRSLACIVCAVFRNPALLS